MATWEVERSTGRCTATGRNLREGEEYYSVLFEEGGSFRRVDYAADSWTGPPPGSFCHFKTRVPVREKKSRMLVDTEVLMGFFERLADEAEPVRVQFRFVLALLLMRQRRLRYAGSERRDGVEVWQMTTPGDGPTHQVVNPRLTDEQIEDVSAQVTAILHGDMAQQIAAIERAGVEEAAAQQPPASPDRPDELAAEPPGQDTPPNATP